VLLALGRLLPERVQLIKNDAVQLPEMEIFRCLRKEAILILRKEANRSRRKDVVLWQDALLVWTAISISKDEEDILLAQVNHRESLVLDW
jgi:hypothetical protein